MYGHVATIKPWSQGQVLELCEKILLRIGLPIHDKWGFIRVEIRALYTWQSHDGEKKDLHQMVPIRLEDYSCL